MAYKRKLLGELLVESGIINQEQLDSLLAEIKDSKDQVKIGRLLIQKGYASEEDIAKCLSDQLNMPYNDLSDLTIDKDLLNYTGL